MISYTHKAREAAQAMRDARVSNNLRQYILERSCLAPTPVRTYVGGKAINLTQLATQTFR